AFYPLSLHDALPISMSPDPVECIAMIRKAKEEGRFLTICHVLRYTPFWSAIKEIIEQGKIGEVVSVQLNENVNYHHMAHSFVRRSEEHTSELQSREK